MLCEMFVVVWCVLICDVGGGMIDFMFVDVVLGDDGELIFMCVGVGNYLMFGGDNMDFVFVCLVELWLIEFGMWLLVVSLL